ncbi:hypothetical protein LXL04_016737 [Taraxacum kok-saghyz]
MTEGNETTWSEFSTASGHRKTHQCRKNAPPENGRFTLLAGNSSADSPQLPIPRHLSLTTLFLSLRRPEKRIPVVSFLLVSLPLLLAGRPRISGGSEMSSFGCCLSSPTTQQQHSEHGLASTVHWCYHLGDPILWRFEGQSSSGANNMYLEDFDLIINDIECVNQKMKGIEVQEQRNKMKAYGMGDDILETEVNNDDDTWDENTYNHGQSCNAEEDIGGASKQRSDYLESPRGSEGRVLMHLKVETTVKVGRNEEPISHWTLLMAFKVSLSKALSSFYPFARRVNGDVSVDCNDAKIFFYPPIIFFYNANPNSFDLPFELSPSIYPPIIFFYNANPNAGIAFGACSSHKIGVVLSNFGSRFQYRIFISTNRVLELR